MCNDRKRQGITETTLSWYKKNAPLYAEETKNSLVYDALGEFLSRVEEKGRILDLGCGSGRDSFFFLQRYYRIINKFSDHIRPIKKHLKSYTTFSFTY